jgi:hypothetical protein
MESDNEMQTKEQADLQYIEDLKAMGEGIARI